MITDSYLRVLSHVWIQDSSCLEFKRDSKRVNRNQVSLSKYQNDIFTFLLLYYDYESCLKLLVGTKQSRLIPSFHHLTIRTTMVGPPSFSYALRRPWAYLVLDSIVPTTITEEDGWFNTKSPSTALKMTSNNSTFNKAFSAGLGPRGKAASWVVAFAGAVSLRKGNAWWSWVSVHLWNQ